MTQDGLTHNASHAAVPIPPRGTTAKVDTSPMLETVTDGGEVSAIIVRCLCEREHIIRIEYSNGAVAG